jgi:chlorobactene glucosyltransferase
MVLSYLTQGLIVSIIYFQLVVLVIVISNILILHQARQHTQLENYPFVSILVPARNEENNIRCCILSLLAQDYPSFELIVLDDQSTDRTFTVLENIALSNPDLNIVVGSSPPPGYSGKNWACTQLAQLAHGDLLLFTDADTIFNRQALKLLLSGMIGEKADLLTGYPRQRMGSVGEYLLVPFFSWAILCFVPLWLAYRIRMPGLSSGNGQMMLFRREAYQKIGGHASLSGVIVEDKALAWRVKSHGLRWRVINIADMVSCRMYSNGRAAFAGFSKNLFAFFDFRVISFLFAYLWLGLVFIEPLIIMVLKIFGLAQMANLPNLLLCIGLSVLVWCIPYWALGIPVGLGMIYPVTMVANGITAFFSLAFSLTGRLTWKGRPLPRPKWKWL